MLEVFPNARSGPNYWPNHMVTMLINCGASVGDAIDAVDPALAVARDGDDASTERFRDALVQGVMAVGARLERQAAADSAAGRIRSAADKNLRAAVLYESVDWQFWPWGSEDPADPGRIFRRARACFRKAIPEAGGVHARAQWVSIPFEGQLLEGLFVPADGVDGPAPVIVHLNGQHSSLHWHYMMGLPAMLAARGVASLLFDHPGVGDARYNKGLMVRADTESYTGAAIDYLATRPDADAARVGVLGGSLGGYRAPRAAAFEPRVKAAIAWGAHYEMYDSILIDWPDVGRKLLLGGTMSADEQKVVDGLHYWTGTTTRDDLDRVLKSLSLKGDLGRITCPLLVVHGAGDVQLPIWHAEYTVRETVNSPRAELMLIDAEQGGTQHCNWDNPRFAMSAMADWAAEVLGAA